MLRYSLITFFTIYNIVWAAEVKIDYKLTPNTRIIIDEIHIGKDRIYCASQNLNIQEREIIISTTGEGFIGRVSKITKGLNGYYLEVDDVSLEEAFEYLKVEYKDNLKNLKIRDVDGIFVKSIFDRSRSDEIFNIKLDNFVVYDYDKDPATKDDRIIVDGVIKLRGDIEWKIDIEKNSFRGFSFVADVDKGSEFEIKISTPIKIPLPFSKEIEIIKYEFMPITVGPVVFTPIISFVAGFKININGDVVVNFKHDISGRYGISYNNQRWDSRVDVKEKSFDGKINFVGGEGSIKGYLGPVFKMNFYNRFTTYIKGSGYLNLNSNTVSLNPFKLFWEMKAGIETILGVRANIFSWLSKDFEKDIKVYETLINSGTIGREIKRIKIRELPQNKDLSMPKGLDDSSFWF